MYQDDTDICWRVRLAGWRVRFVPEAVVAHDYEFDEGLGEVDLARALALVDGARATAGDARATAAAGGRGRRSLRAGALRGGWWRGAEA